MTPLHELFVKHGSDKAWHGYARHYEPFLEPLREQPNNSLLEIGICSGASLRAWWDWFHDEDCVRIRWRIFGVDHNPTTVKDFSAGDRPGIEVHEMDATYSDQWEWPRIMATAVNGFTAVVDDGAHTVWAQYQAFKHGWPLLKPSGYWFIEDCHSSHDPAYRRDNERNGLPEAVTIMDVIFRECGRRLHEFGDSQCGRFTTVESDIESVTYTKSLIILRKRSTKGAEQ